MKASTPWWLSAAFALGLLELFVGQRVVAHLDTASTFFTWLGLAMVLGSTALRIWALVRSSGQRRSVELTLLATQLVALVGLGLYWLGSRPGTLGITEEKSIERWKTVSTILWSILMGVSLVPMLLIETSLGVAGRGGFATGERAGDEGVVELRRVREMGANGLTIALAAAFLMVTCNVAEQRDVRKDVSFFKTSAPGSSTIAMAASLSEPIKVHLFFPEVNEVGDEVAAYFRDLAAQSGGKLEVERTDRMLVPALTKELKVAVDGTIVLQKGTQNEKVTVNPDIAKARREELRELDGKVQKALMKVLRAKRVAYISVGHGELNDAQSAGPMGFDAIGEKATLFKDVLKQYLNYDVKDWDGFGKPVPDDASILFVVAPNNPFGPEELEAIDAYLARGGSLLLSLRPGQPFDLGPLAGRLGVTFDPTQLADDKEYRVSSNTPADRADIITNSFASHASVTTLNRVGVHYALMMPDTGSLVDAPFASKGEAPKRTYVVRSMTSAFADADGDFEADDGEKRAAYNLAAAIEDKNAKPEKPREGQPTNGMRAIVFATGKAFVDVVWVDRRFGLNQAMFVDAVRWLGGEEAFAGETVSEKDVSIEHTKSEDVAYFYGSIIGAPLLVLLLRLLASVAMRMWGRRVSQRRAS
jgi:hypothetical protein